MMLQHFVLAAVLLLAGVAATPRSSAVVGATTGSSNDCTSQLMSLCESARGASIGDCLVCAGGHQSELMRAGCTNDNFDSWCDGVPEINYVELSTSCRDAIAISPLINVSSVSECENECDKQAAAAPGKGTAACVGCDTNGQYCYLKSHCGGTPGHCPEGKGCGYRNVNVHPPPPPSPSPPVPPSPPGVTLRQAAERHNIFIGAATNVHGVTGGVNPLYKPTEQAQFSLTTAENACKVGPIHPKHSDPPAPSDYNWDGCDTIFKQAEAANQTVRGHNLCWHNENPSWLTSGKWTPAQLTSILQEHITTVVSRYGPRAYCWDVVNEALDDHGLKPSPPWYPAVPDYIDTAFHAAFKAAGNKTKLFYNDCENPPYRAPVPWNRGAWPAQWIIPST